MFDFGAPWMHQQLLDWWERHGRHGIPWKQGAAGGLPVAGEWLDPYPIWIAEVMLQQTQLKVVLPYWQRWQAAMPSLEAVAAAAEQDLFLLWQGLGYYSRARRLKQGALQLLAASPNAQQPPAGVDPPRVAPPQADRWPRSLEGWQALPGIGRTTAGSILSSAFDQPEAILDGNVKRVLARLIACPEPPARQTAAFWQLSEHLLDRQRPRAFNLALMELGALVCTPRQPACGVCPWHG
jgi:A/G-specific adenine glycosylase